MPRRPKIERFEGEYEFLSNFYAMPIEYEGLIYPSSEAAFQAAKTTNKAKRIRFMGMTDPRKAKRAGRALKLRPNWERIKLDVMLAILRIKFGSSPLREMLLNTGNAQLIEGNWWGDRFWGVCDGEGENHLGRLLMQVRAELRNR